MLVRHTSQGPGIASIALAGVFDHASVHQVEALLPDIAPGTELTVDLGGVTAIDSSGLGCLLRVRDQCGRDGAVRIRLGHPSVTSVIRMAGFERMFTLVDPARE